MKWITGILPHVQIILAGMMITFYLIDRVNTAMAFINNDITKTLLFFFSVLAIINAALLIHKQRKEQ